MYLTYRSVKFRAAIDQLRESLLAPADPALPEYLPVLGYGLKASVPVVPASDAAVHLPALLSRALLAFTFEFERESELSLAICANVLRVLDGTRVRDLPRLAGVSKEAVSVSVGFLRRGGYAVVEPDSKRLRLTPKGRTAHAEYLRLLDLVEQRWQERFGVAALRESLERLLAAPAFLEGLEPHPGGWRASLPKPETLPHHPLVLHRGGFPDTS
jgi:DNA-binding MarR family transcriptional regulator